MSGYDKLSHPGVLYQNMIECSYLVNLSNMCSSEIKCPRSPFKMSVDQKSIDFVLPGGRLRALELPPQCFQISETHGFT